MKTTLEPTAKANILIIDNILADLNLLSAILIGQGYQIQTAASGQAVLMMLQKAAPDLILLAINLPGLNGYDLCHQLKDNDKTKHIPVIFISDVDDGLDKMKAFAAGGVDYIAKPFHLEEVLVHVKTHLTMHHLQHQLETQVRELKTLTNRLQSELALARKIQQGLLPPPSPNWPQLDVACFTESAREVGGDFYTYYAFDTRLERDKNRFAVAVGDVSGKGMPAALLMTISLASFKTSISQKYSFNKLVTDLVSEPYSLNKFFNDIDEAIAFYTSTTGQNCALAYIELTKPTKPQQPVTLRAINAGCVMPIIRRGDNTVEWVDVGGLPLGVGLKTDFEHPEQTLTLSSGDLVILSSDGVIEANNSAAEMLGFDRLEHMVATGPTTSAQAMLNHLKDQIAAFVGNTEPHDDLTLVVVRV